MTTADSEQRLASMKKSLIALCHDNGIIAEQDAERAFKKNLIETGAVDSMAFVCLQELVETRYRVTISQEQFVGELNTLARLTEFLAADPQVEVSG